VIFAAISTYLLYHEAFKNSRYTGRYACEFLKTSWQQHLSIVKHSSTKIAQLRLKKKTGGKVFFTWQLVPDTGFFTYCFPSSPRDKGALASRIAMANHYTGYLPCFLTTTGFGTYAFIYCLPFRGECIVSLAYYIPVAGRDTYSFIYFLSIVGHDTYAFVYCIGGFKFLEFPTMLIKVNSSVIIQLP
jgi:hypothetical protein